MDQIKDYDDEGMRRTGFHFHLISILASVNMLFMPIAEWKTNHLVCKRIAIRDSQCCGNLYRAVDSE